MSSNQLSTGSEYKPVIWRPWVWSYANQKKEYPNAHDISLTKQKINELNSLKRPLNFSGKSFLSYSLFLYLFITFSSFLSFLYHKQHRVYITYMELLMVKSGKTSGKVHLLNNTNYPTELGPIMINDIRSCHSDACVTSDRKVVHNLGLKLSNIYKEACCLVI